MQQQSSKPYASQARYDALYMGASLDHALEKVDNESGEIAWGLSYRMMSLNEMHRTTGAVRYLEANHACIRAVVRARDDRTGARLWTGDTAPAWGSSKYAERGRAVFAVHTAMITYPILDFLLLARENPRLRSALGAEFDSINAAVGESLAYHDRQWRDGPGVGEGHYVGSDQEGSAEGKPLPANRLSAMGRALWLSWKLNGSEVHRSRVLALARYIRNRLSAADDGAYYWSYSLPREPLREAQPMKSIKAEDISHAALTVALPILLAQEGQVFTRKDLKRFGKTAGRGFARRPDGVLFGDITGNPGSSPAHVQLPARWLRLAPFFPKLRKRIVRFYEERVESPGPLDMALLLGAGRRN